MTITWRHQYDFKRDQDERLASEMVPKGQSLTIQSEAKDSDINEIVRRFGIGDGTPLPPALGPEFYGDLTDVPDLRAILDIGREAQEHFQALPARIRTRFRNDPAELWAWINNPENGEEAADMGLLVRPKAETPPGPPPNDTVVTPPPPATPPA